MRKVVLAIFSLLVAACTSIECPVNNMVAINYQLQKSDGSTDTLLVDTLWVRTPTPQSDKKDSLILNRLCGATATKFSLPVSHTLPEDVICMTVKDTIGTTWLDTIWVQKNNYDHFESVDCQASYFHTITGVRFTHRLIDTLIINNTEVNYDPSTTHLLLRLKARR